MVAHGEGVYGFLHRALQEYFVAQHLVNQTEQVIEHLRSQCLNPLWREPIILAVGLISQPKSPNSRRLLPEAFAALLEAPDPAGDLFPRRALLAATACAECERLPPGVVLRIAESLLLSFALFQGSKGPPVLQETIEHAFTTCFQSAAAGEAETALCGAIRAPEHALRCGAVELTLRLTIDSSSLAEALLYAWETYAEPAGALLVALDNMYQRRPECFKGTLLPPGMRASNSASLPMQRIIHTLSSKVGRFKKRHNQNVSDDMRRSLLSQLHSPETAQARDAAIVLSILEEMSWIQVYKQSASGQEDLLQSVIESLVLLRFLQESRPYLLRSWDYLSTYRIDGRIDGPRVRIRAHELIHLYIYNLVTGFSYWTQLFSYSRWHFKTALESALSFVPKRIWDLEPYLMASFLPWERDAVHTEIPPKGDVRFSNEPHRSSQLLDRAWNTLWKSPDAFPRPARSSLHESPITHDNLPLLINELNSLDGIRSEHARLVFATRRSASTIGRDVIEYLAILTMQYTNHPWIQSHLTQALQEILHDQPEWVHHWVELANTSQDIGCSQMILSSIRHITWEAFQELLSAMNDASPLVKKMVLPTISQLLLYIAQGKLERLLIKGIEDKQNLDTRRFALAALSYVRSVTPAVASALLAACQDVQEMQRDAIEAAGRFQSIEGDLLQELIPFLTSHSESTAYVVARLLGALAMSTVGEATELRVHIVHALVNALTEHGKKREGRASDKLKHALYTALVRTTGWKE